MSAWRWDLFCTVVDNFGDIGVCLRLARQLVHEHGAAVRLWVDDIESYRQLAGMQATEPVGLEVRHWQTDPVPNASADVVVVGFSCRLPDAYLAGMVARAQRPVWINLEYLSAEAWVEGCHRLPSPHPRLPLVERFFYPGFTARTGGLIREEGLLHLRDAFRADADAQAASWRALQTPPPPPSALRVSMFSYETPAAPALLQAWAEGSRPVWCGVPSGRVWQSLTPWVGEVLAVGQVMRRGNLLLAPLAFVDQDGYDRLLWACDLNIVRGEDSFVRAQWAGRPFVWHIYPQDDAVHIDKLDAFLDRYEASMPAAQSSANRQMQLAWNHGAQAGPAWDQFAAALPELTIHAEGWCRELAAQKGLAAALVDFAKSELK